MTRNVLLDTNLLIAAFDNEGSTSQEKRNAALEQLTELLEDPEARVFITPLIRYEVLRGVKWDNQDTFNDLIAILNQFPELDITRQVAELAANLFRFDRSQHINSVGSPINIEKRKFDVFHYCCAFCNDGCLTSQDTDIGKISRLHCVYQQHISTH